MRSLFFYRLCLLLTSGAAHRVRKCRHCERFFLQRLKHRKLYCNDLCRFRSHNRARSGKRAASSPRQTPAAVTDDGPLWRRKYRGKLPPR
ncbi:MAG: DUF6076 domain-containing protein [Nitrospinota bacterium]